MKGKKIKITQTYLTEIKAERDRLKERVQKVEKDRDLFREEFLFLLKENIKMCSQNQYYSSATMINRLSRLMNKVENWWWA